MSTTAWVCIPPPSGWLALAGAVGAGTWAHVPAPASLGDVLVPMPDPIPVTRYLPIALA